MKLTGIGDEAADLVEGQLGVARDLGWSHIELRNLQIAGGSRTHAHDLDTAGLDHLRRNLESAGIQVCCLSSNVLKTGGYLDPWQPRLDQLKRDLDLCAMLKVPLLRIMSFEPGPEEFRIPAEVFRRVREVVERCLDAGVQPVHENCRNYGGLSPSHSLELLDKCPGLKWCFDTGNPIANPDRSKGKPWPRQDSWVYWQTIRDHVLHVHLKDNGWNAEKKSAEAAWPGDGESRVLDILRDAHRARYAGFVSLEPSLARGLIQPTQLPEAPEAIAASKKTVFLDFARVVQSMLADIAK